SIERAGVVECHGQESLITALPVKAERLVVILCRFLLVSQMLVAICNVADRICFASLIMHGAANRQNPQVCVECLLKVVHTCVFHGDIAQNIGLAILITLSPENLQGLIVKVEGLLMFTQSSIDSGDVVELDALPLSIAQALVDRLSLGIVVERLLILA